MKYSASMKNMTCMHNRRIKTITSFNCRNANLHLRLIDSLASYLPDDLIYQTQLIKRNTHKGFGPQQTRVDTKSKILTKNHPKTIAIPKLTNPTLEHEHDYYNSLRSVEV
jgi:hypothetical protein